MKKTLLLLLIILSGITFSLPLHAQERTKRKVAVYMTGSTSEAAYKKVIGAKLVSAITESGEYAAVERTADFLDALSAENDYQTSGEVANNQIARLGKKFGARYVVAADVSELFDEVFIDARLINVESGLVEKAFDTSGPADSMAQLVTLSKQVAQGLLGKGNHTAIQGFATQPVNMSLCAVKDGNVVFISPLQWQQMPELEKITFNKKGICLIDNGNIFIVAMQDAGYGSVYKARQLQAPTLAQLIIMYNNLRSLNTALQIFGGKPLNDCAKEDSGYVSSDYSNDSSKSYRLSMRDGQYREDTWIDYPDNYIRTVYKLNEII